MAHLTNFSFELFYEIFTEDASQLPLYHGAKESKMTKNSNQGGGSCLKCLIASLGICLILVEYSILCSLVLYCYCSWLLARQVYTFTLWMKSVSFDVVNKRNGCWRYLSQFLVFFHCWGNRCSFTTAGISNTCASAWKLERQ